MRRTKLTVVAVAFAVLSAISVTAGPSAQAAANCTNAAFGTAATALGKPAPVGTPYTCANPVHPGAYIKVEGSYGGSGGGCTANFVFSGSDGRTYLGTAGHCTLVTSNISGDRGEYKDAPGAGARVWDRNNRLIGRIAYAILLAPKDFALIRLEPGITVDKAMPHWGPVTGTYAAQELGPVELRWVGHGVGIGNALYARSGTSLWTTSSDRVNGIGLIAPGDSGGPVVDARGRAVGVNVAIGAGAQPQVITRLNPQLARAAAFTGVTYTLAT